MSEESQKLTGKKSIDPLLIKAAWNIIHYFPIMIPANGTIIFIN